MSRQWLVGIDIGGTFTDVVALRPGDETVRTAKVPSRPDDPLGALLAALDAVGVEHAQVENLIHGTTRITNAIVEGKLPPVALVTTAGFEDVLAIGRLRRRDLYRLDVPPKLPPLVPAERTLGVVERVGHDGAVHTTLIARRGAAPRSRRCAQPGWPASPCPCCTPTPTRPTSRRWARRCAGRLPHVSLSHEINPEAREFERTSSTVLNAAAMPVVVDYLDSLLRAGAARGSLPAVSLRRRLGHAGGGARAPAGDGPVRSGRRRGGVHAAARAIIERNDVLTFDMGGTTTDVCLVVDGEAEVTDQRDIAERPMRQPMVAIHSIGAGGGSIVRLDSGGLSVGPDSAGADPGPACYGTRRYRAHGHRRQRGARLSEHRHGAWARPSPWTWPWPERALAPIAEALGRGVVETALGVVRVANATMARALRRVTVERGIDGRRCTLLAFGGAGPMHAVGLAREFGICEVVVPPVSSAFSAYGCLLADMAYTRQRTVRLAAPGLRHGALRGRARGDGGRAGGAVCRAWCRSGGGGGGARGPAALRRTEFHGAGAVRPCRWTWTASAPASRRVTRNSTATPRRSPGSWRRCGCGCRIPPRRVLATAGEAAGGRSRSSRSSCWFMRRRRQRPRRAITGSTWAPATGRRRARHHRGRLVDGHRARPGGTCRCRCVRQPGHHGEVAAMTRPRRERAGSVPGGGDPPRPQRRGGGDVPGGDALRPLAAAARGRGPVIDPDRPRGRAHRPGSRHSGAPGGDELHGQAVPAQSCRRNAWRPGTPGW